MDKIDAFISKHDQWKKELSLLRKLLQKEEVEENLKWGAPVYSVNNKNIIGIGAFKSYVGLWFFQGVFLNDHQNLLINASEGKTKGLRQIRFQSVDDIKENVIRSYIKEAIENQKQGKEIQIDRTKIFQIPQELKAAFKTKQGLKEKFESLSAGKQKEYANYITEAKHEKTRLSRLAKSIPMIEDQKGLYNKYKNC